MYWLPTASCMHMIQLKFSGHDQLFLMQCTDWPGTLARHMIVPRKAHFRTLMALIKYIVSTENRRIVLAPKERWSPQYKIHGQLNSDYAMNLDGYRSISDGRVFMYGTNIIL